MITLTGLSIYPVKSCRGIDLDEAKIGPCGLEARAVGDREWTVVSPDGASMTQRECPALARIAPNLPGDGLILSHPGLPDFALRPARTGARIDVRLWGSTFPAFDEGDAVAGWLAQALGLTDRLARFDPSFERASDLLWTGGAAALNRFSDGFPMLLTSKNSLADFNSRWTRGGRAPLPMDRFRPNLVIEGIGAYEEDHLAALVAEGIELRPVKPCARCSIPSVDQTSGETGASPLEVLAGYRFVRDIGGAAFGQNLIAARGQGTTLRIGMQFTEQWNF